MSRRGHPRLARFHIHGLRERGIAESLHLIFLCGSCNWHERFSDGLRAIPLAGHGLPLVNERHARGRQVIGKVREFQIVVQLEP